MDISTNEHKHNTMMEDCNVDLLKYNYHNKAYVDNLFSNIYKSNRTKYTTTGIIIRDVADQLGTYHSVKNKSTRHIILNTKRDQLVITILFSSGFIVMNVILQKCFV